MKNKNYLSDQIRNNIPKRNIEEGRESVRMFVEMLKKRKINVIDEAILNRAYEEEDYVDEKMLGLVLKALKIDEPVQYIPRYIRNMNAFYANGTKVVVVDELLEYTMYSLENNRSEENVTRCMKNFYVLEDLQNGKREIGTHNETQLYEMSLLPENLMHTAMDNYWTIWTFLIGHELYHAIHPEDRNGKDTELRADQYAYRLLINLIMQQKKNEVPEELQVFWEDQYLSPIILFEMFRLFDVYSELKGKEIVYQDHPTPKERQDNIFSMFKDDIPEEMNTEEGNKVLNLILNSSEYAEDWLRYKISKGKL